MTGQNEILETTNANPDDPADPMRIETCTHGTKTCAIAADRVSQRRTALDPFIH